VGGGDPVTDQPVRHVATIFGGKTHYAHEHAGSTFCGARVASLHHPDREVDCANCVKVFEHHRKLAANGEPR
jgi:hypothetical protein